MNITYNNVLQMHFSQNQFFVSVYIFKMFSCVLIFAQNFQIPIEQYLYILQEIYAFILECWFIKVFKITMKSINMIF